MLIVAGGTRSGLGHLGHALANSLGRGVRDVSAAFGMAGRQAAMAARHQAQLSASCHPHPFCAPFDDVAAVAARAFWAPCLKPAARSPILLAAALLPDAAVLHGVELLLRQQPRARLVLLLRDGVAAVASRRRAWPGLGFADHCLAWARAADAVQQLQALYPARVFLLRLESLGADADATAAALAAFCALPPAARLSLAEALRTPPYHNRTAFDPAHPPCNLAEAGWSTPEQELFDDLCAPAMRRAGYADRLWRREVAAPLSLQELALNGLLRHRRLALTLTPEVPAECLHLRPMAEGAFLIFPGIAPAGRQEFTVHLRAPRSNTGPIQLRLDILGSLTRRPCLGRDITLQPGEDHALQGQWRSTESLLDISIHFAAPSLRAGTGCVMLQDGQLRSVC